MEVLGVHGGWRSRGAGGSGQLEVNVVGERLVGSECGGMGEGLVGSECGGMGEGLELVNNASIV